VLRLHALRLPSWRGRRRRHARADLGDDGFLVVTFARHETAELALMDAFTLAAEYDAFPVVFAAWPLV